MLKDITLIRLALKFNAKKWTIFCVYLQDTYKNITFETTKNPVSFRRLHRVYN